MTSRGFIIDAISLEEYRDFNAESIQRFDPDRKKPYLDIKVIGLKQEIVRLFPYTTVSPGGRSSNTTRIRFVPKGRKISPDEGDYRFLRECVWCQQKHIWDTLTGFSVSCDLGRINLQRERCQDRPFNATWDIPEQNT